MTTATSLEVLDAVYCCYSNFAYIGTNCVASFTEGTFLVDDSTIAFGPSQTDLFNSAASKYLGVNLRGPPTLGAIGTPIVLVGQRLLGNSSSISDSPTRSSSTPQASEGTTQVGDGLGKDRARSSTKLKVGVSVGVSVGILFLICICFLFIRRYRRKRLGQLGSADTPADKEKSAEYGDKPELEGSAANPGMFIKAELDALEIRAELEGSPGEEYDVDGVGVLKPELHGTPGVTGLLGVYVKKKAELEAPSKRNAVILTSSLQLDPAQGKLATNTTTEPAELES
ncbi:hypothetical protein F5Y10DRAFT_290276 [Nemania abortiva]|nr:hypothetical protein F5Y10DRAFT_290276 [Nemania abortiva]